MDLSAIQTELRRQHLHGWLFYDHHHRDPIAYRILDLPEQMMVSRRWYYLIPADGIPRKLVHRIESGALATLPGETTQYSQWSELDMRLREMLARLGSTPRVAMQYSPACAIPAISLADAGTLEQVRQLGAEVVSSGDLISTFDARWSDFMLASHRKAGQVIQSAISEAFVEVRRRLDQSRPWDEYELQQWLVERMSAGGLAPEEPIVAVNAHAGDPHYQPGANSADPIRPGDLLLLDVWGKVALPGTAYYDVTWMGYCLRPGETHPPAEFEQAFAVVRDARDAGIDFVSTAIAAGRPVRGFEIDQAVRRVVAEAGFGEFFVHRTGHSLGREVHSTGANLDDFETHDDRRILPDSGFTIEPGIYCPHGRPFGVRTEVNLVAGTSAVEVTAPRQPEIVRI